MIVCDKVFIGRKFREYRKRSFLTQEELSEKIGIAEKHYGRLERGEFLPSLDTFFNIVNVLKIPLTEFGINQNEEIPYSENKNKLLNAVYNSDENDVLLILNIIENIKVYNKNKRI